MKDDYYAPEELSKWVVECDRHTIGSVKFVASLLEEAGHLGKVSILDVGANVGAFPKLLESYYEVGQLVAVEPYSQFTDIILHRYPDATVFNCLASDSESDGLCLYGGKEGNLGCARVLDGAYNTDNEYMTSFPSLPTWEFIQNVNGFNPDVVKIDAEGYDEKVLLGLLPYIRISGRRPIIIFEWAFDRDVDATLEKYYNLGYELRGMYQGMMSGDLALICK